MALLNEILQPLPHSCTKLQWWCYDWSFFIFVFLNYILKNPHKQESASDYAFSSNCATIWDTILLAESGQLVLFQYKENWYDSIITKEHHDTLLSSWWLHWIHTCSRNEMHSYFKYDLMLSNNLLEISSKYMSILAEKFRLLKLWQLLSVFHSQPMASDIPWTPWNLWHLSVPVVMLQLLKLLKYTAIPNMCCPPCYTRSEKQNCWLSAIIYYFEQVFPAKYLLKFYPGGMPEWLPESEIRCRRCTTDYIPFLK